MSDFVLGLIIGAMVIGIIWLVRSVIFSRVKGTVTLDLTGDGAPVSLDLSSVSMDDILKMRVITLNLDVILPKPYVEDKKNEK